MRRRTIGTVMHCYVKVSALDLAAKRKTYCRVWLAIKLGKMVVDTGTGIVSKKLKKCQKSATEREKGRERVILTSHCPFSLANSAHAQEALSFNYLVKVSLSHQLLFQRHQENVVIWTSYFTNISGYNANKIEDSEDCKLRLRQLAIGVPDTDILPPHEWLMQSKAISEKSIKITTKIPHSGPPRYRIYVLGKT
ncbi:unnamed protein product [Dovyalis caffra]|uniref:Uncharacterized protein n=1 Tax=Dovyalis caffra TaxID=77055 RepID=A0AAV1RC42_9ROSI|nr:unnamed protein product [Dovyalis caffra]